LRPATAGAIVLTSSSEEADPPSARVERVVLNALANKCGFAAYLLVRAMLWEQDLAPRNGGGDCF
jgi:hypothetical protein